MVALPLYLLASSGLSSVNSFFSRATSSVSTTAGNQPTNHPFASVRGPLVQTNFADPAVIYVNGVTYSFATNNRGIGPNMIHVQIATSKDNKTWTLLDHQDALPKVGKWQTGNRVWAPDVVRAKDGSFVMYYSDEVKASPAFHCIGAATSKTVTGPYTPIDTPFACPDVKKLGGAIDPDGFLDTSTGKRYVTYKVDGNSLGHGGMCSNSIAPILPTPIMLQEVKDDGLTHVGDPIQILDRDKYDGPLIEAPSLYRSHEGIYFLFFSSNCFTTPLYDTSYATATNIRGPYTKSRRPLFITGDGPELQGPGGMDIIPGGEMIVFHGQLNINNSPAELKLAQDQSKQTGKPMKDINLPFVRGLYSGQATFSGNTVSLA